MGRRRKRSRRTLLVLLFITLGLMAFGWQYIKNTSPTEKTPTTTVTTHTEIEEQKILPPEGMETGELPESF